MADTMDCSVYLSKYLADGKLDKVHEASKVDLPHSSVDVESWAGYITVNEERGDHMFVWYIRRDEKSKSDEDNAPLMIWLNGGPGYSSMVALFEEIGPFQLDETNKVSKREVAWTDHFSLLLIDNPVGAGFSYRESSYDESMSTSDTGDNLFECVTQFFKIFPEVKTKDLYIGGQSYGGKYVPSLAYKLHQSPNPDINIKGIYIAAGFMSPKKMLPLMADILVHLGIISKHSGETMTSHIKKAIEDMKTDPQEGVKAIIEHIFEYQKGVCGYPNYENMVSTKAYDWKLASYLNLPEVQQAIHAKPREFKTLNENTLLQMSPDFMTGLSHEMSVLMENYRVLLFNGQMDPIVSVIMTEAFLTDLRWSGKEEYSLSEKRLWKNAAGDVSGYVTTVKDLTWLILSKAGHRTAIDQPRNVLDMMLQFTRNETM